MVYYNQNQYIDQNQYQMNAMPRAYGGGGIGRSGKPDYTQYTAYMEDVLGRRRSQYIVDEKNTTMVTTFSAGVGTSTSSEVTVIDIKAVAGQIVSMMGTAGVPAGSDANTAHPVRIRLAGTNDVEISQLTKIRITKESTVEDIINLGRPFYQDISMTKQVAATVAGLGYGNLWKDRTLWFRFDTNIELNGEEHMKYKVVSEAPTGGPNLPDIAIDSTHVKVSQQVDVWV